MMAWGQNDSLAPISMPIKEGDSIITIQADTVNNTGLFHSLWNYGNKGVKLTQKGLKLTEVNIEKLEVNDTSYISPNKFNLTVMTEYSYWYEYYELRAKESGQKIMFAPDMRHKLGLYGGWRWIFVGWSFDLEDILQKGSSNSDKTDWNFSFYTNKIGFDIYYRRTGNDFKIRNLTGFKDENGKELTDYSHDFSGMRVYQRGLNLYYIFNNKHFSYPAAYSQSTNQRKSAGSLIAGISVSQQIINMNREELDPKVLAAMDSSLYIDRVSYYDYSINAGYSYNWVFAKNWLANLSLTPALGYKRSTLQSNTRPDLKTIFNNLNVDLVSRAGITYNDSKYYIGASFVGHFYTYRRDRFSLINSFGVLRVYAGFNFWKR